MAKLFHFDLHLCGISSLAHVGGVAAMPVLAAAYSPHWCRWASCSRCWVISSAPGSDC